METPLEFHDSLMKINFALQAISLFTSTEVTHNVSIDFRGRWMALVRFLQFQEAIQLCHWNQEFGLKSRFICGFITVVINKATCRYQDVLSSPRTVVICMILVPWSS